MIEMETNRRGKCQLCGAKNGQFYMGGPMGCVCPRCSKIVNRYAKAKESHQQMWKSVNNADLSKLREHIESVKPEIVKDYLLEITSRVEEILLQCGELDRVLYNAANEIPSFATDKPKTKAQFIVHKTALRAKATPKPKVHRWDTCKECKFGRDTGWQCNSYCKQLKTEIESALTDMANDYEHMAQGQHDYVVDSVEQVHCLQAKLKEMTLAHENACKQADLAKAKFMKEEEGSEVCGSTTTDLSTKLAVANTLNKNREKTIAKAVKHIAELNKEIDKVQDCNYKGCKNPRLGTCYDHTDVWQTDLKELNCLKSAIQYLCSGGCDCSKCPTKGKDCPVDELVRGTRKKILEKKAKTERY